ncbi:hypothetical protein QTL97_15525 [Sporosarcina thermotolerans]|uniref:Uncharacterized protein n=1 Tax=Sporosarcina thermotolerans TaxID=633404 RepID=A0AAW9AF77_9BACL|nr:hypothetical protein [Sporosarcina thermotolerans]MDW0118341.1 hypothetical protein [Sporosarcina thermotolerans]
MNGDIAKQILAELQGIKAEMTEFKAEMAEFKAEMTEFKAEMKEFKAEMTEFKAEMTGEIKGIKDELKLTNERLSNLEEKQQLIYDQTAHLTEFRTETTERFEQLATKKDLEFFDFKIIQHEREIFNLTHQS